MFQGIFTDVITSTEKKSVFWGSIWQHLHVVALVSKQCSVGLTAHVLVSACEFLTIPGLPDKFMTKEKTCPHSML